jgi:hypothetical protein
VSAKKHDQDKIDLSLLPLPALELTAQALMYGEKKYGRNNFREGFDTNRLVAAALRHLFAWQNGRDLDEESGVSHLGHAIAAISMLVTNLADRTAKDGRYKAPLFKIDRDEDGRVSYRKDMTLEEFKFAGQVELDDYLRSVAQYNQEHHDDDDY